MDYLEIFTQVPIGRQRMVFDDGFTELDYGPASSHESTATPQEYGERSGGADARSSLPEMAAFSAGLAALCLFGYVLIRKKAEPRPASTAAERDQAVRSAQAQQQERLEKAVKLSKFKWIK